MGVFDHVVEQVEGGMVIGKDTAYGRELYKWEQDGRPGHRPQRKYEPYPKMLYKAGRDGSSGVVEAALMKTVHDEAERDRAFAEGFRESPDEAVKEFEKWDDLMAEEAARRAYRDQGMSAKAKAEVERAEANSGIDMLPSIPETPVRKRVGWPKGKPRRPKADPPAA